MEFGHHFIKTGDHCIDAGANQGIYSLSFASVVRTSGKVVAVEPFDSCIKILKKNILINKFNNISIEKKVLYKILIFIKS